MQYTFIVTSEKEPSLQYTFIVTSEKEAITSHENSIATLRNLRKYFPCMRTFQRKNIAEQCTHGGKILNLV